MKLMRMFSKERYKGSRNYLNSQKKYEILRTVLYFGISLSLFLSGYLITKEYNIAHGYLDADPRKNLLTLVAVLGCLPASKSAVEAILYCRFHSCSREAADRIEQCCRGAGLFDMAFTSYAKNYCVAHMLVRGNTVCGYTEDDKFDENGFYQHINEILKTDHFQSVTVKIFTDLKKYTDRLEQLMQLEEDPVRTSGITNTLKSVSL